MEPAVAPVVFVAIAVTALALMVLAIKPLAVFVRWLSGSRDRSYEWHRDRFARRYGYTVADTGAIITGALTPTRPGGPTESGGAADGAARASISFSDSRPAAPPIPDPILAASPRDTAVLATGARAPLTGARGAAGGEDGVDPLATTVLLAGRGDLFSGAFPGDENPTAILSTIPLTGSDELAAVG